MWPGNVNRRQRPIDEVSSNRQPEGNQEPNQNAEERLKNNFFHCLPAPSEENWERESKFEKLLLSRS